MRDYEVTGQSLLTRDYADNWKFAHKSILEFLLAREATKNFSFWQELNLEALDMARQFLIEAGMPLPGYFIFVKGGTFLMGSPDSEAMRQKERETQHQVKVSDFFMAKYPVTQKQWKEIMGNKPAHFQQDENCPVEKVSWDDVQQFIQKLNAGTNGKFRLPTEAEWEYACRAGTTTAFNTGNNLTTDQANYNGNHPYENYPKGKYIGKTTPVGSYLPNAWGLYDMHGNVWEWCSDWYGEKYYDECKKHGVVENPTGPTTGSNRVLRGGYWPSHAQYCRSAYRINISPDYRNYDIGFRLVFVPKSVG